MKADLTTISLESPQVLNKLTESDASTFIVNCSESQLFGAENSLCVDKSDYSISEEKWDLLSDRIQISKALFLPSFDCLRNSMNLDGNNSDLSALDVELLMQERADTQQRRCEFEKLFIQENGLPEKIVIIDSNQNLPQNTYALVMMSTAECYALVDNGVEIFVCQIDETTGRFVEQEVAVEGLEKMERLFLDSGLAAKTSAVSFSNGAPSTLHFLFGEQDYLLPNGRSRIAVRPDCDLNNVFMTQPTNGCVAATLINAALKQGVVLKDWNYVQKAYERLGSGRVSMETLATVPGVLLTRIGTDKLKTSYEQGQSIMVVIPEFNSHAALITSVREQAEGLITFQFADSVTGMIQTKDISYVPPAIGSIEDSSEQVDHIARSIKAGIQSARTKFYSVTISDPIAFRAWLE